MGKKIVTLIAVFFMLVSMSSVSFAEYGCKRDQKGHGKKSMEDKFFMKVKMIYTHKDQIEVTEEQMDKIKDLKIALKKELIIKKAEVEVIALDITVGMHEDVINVEDINKLIDKKYDVKKAKMKSLIKACADLKNLLTEEQSAKLKEVFHSQMMKKSLPGTSPQKKWHKG